MRHQGCDFVQDDIGGDACTDIVRETPGPDGCEVTEHGCCGTNVNEGFGCCSSDPTLAAAGPDGYGCAGYVPSTTTPPPTTTLPPTNPPTNPPTDPLTNPPTDPVVQTNPPTNPPTTAPPTVPVTGEPTQATLGSVFEISFNGDYNGLTDTQVTVPFENGIENGTSDRGPLVRAS